MASITRKALLTTLLGLLGLVVSSARMSVATEYAVTDLGTLGGASSLARGINASGQVAGQAYTVSGKTHACLWEDGLIRDLGTLGGSESRSAGINASGQIVGYADITESGWHAFLWEDGAMRDLGTLGGSASRAAGINDSGQVVGDARTASGAWRAFLWENDVMQDLGTIGSDPSRAYAINNLGQVVGEVYTDMMAARSAYLWENGVMLALGNIGGYMTWPTGINDSGQVVGVDATQVDSHAFLWEDGVMRDLGTLGGDITGAWGINNVCQVVGYSRTADDDCHAFLWENDVMYDLNDSIPSDSGWILETATAINDLGQIVGYGSYDGHGIRAFLLTSVSTVTTPGIGVWGRYDPANSDKPFFNAGWNWWSVPYPPAGGADPASFAGFSLEILRNRLFRWENTTTQLYPDDFTTVEPYHGYLAYLGSPIDEVSYQAQLPVSPTVEIELVPGWNWIGVPVTMPVASVQIRNDQTDEVRTADEDKAMGANAWLNWNWTFFDSASRTYRLVSLGGGADDVDLRQWFGYRLMLTTLNPGETYTLIAPSQ